MKDERLYYVQNIDTIQLVEMLYVKGFKRSSKYTVWAVMLCMSKESNPMYVEAC